MELDSNPSSDDSKGTIIDPTIYDPLFVVLLTSQVLKTATPVSPLSWVSFFRTNAVSLLFRCLSSKDKVMRQIATTQLGTLYGIMKVREF